MLTALLRWMKHTRKDQRTTPAKSPRSLSSREDALSRACASLLPESLRQLWNAQRPARSLNLETFEDRLLFNAALAPMPAPVTVEVVVAAPLDATTIDAKSVPPPVSESVDESASAGSSGILSAELGGTTSKPSTAATLIVVDPTVPDAEELLELLTSLRTGTTDILVLNSQRDGLEQIAERLEQLGETRAIHILSHGDEAGLHLGSNWLSADTIAFRSNTLTQWQNSLTADADVLLYGCDLAANPTGQQFLRTFSEMTGADVAASTDATGAALLGGDWQLEFQFGSVEERSLGEQRNLFEWNGLLTTNTYQQGVSSYTGTQDTTINASTPGTANGASTTVTIGGASAKAGLIRFDSLFGNGPNQIPVGSTIHSASLRVNVTTGTATESTITLHRVLANWSEASTWNTLGSGLSRDDVEVATVADSLVTGTTAPGLRTISGLEESLQAWSDGEANNGWALFGDNTSGWIFTSSQGATAGQRPMLIVDFTPPTAAPVGELLATGETRINVTTTNAQSTATNGRNSHDAVGVDANGNYVIVWTSELGDGNGAGVYGQRFNSRGLAQGSQFRINQTTTDNQQWASVAMKSDGGFIVTWTSQNQDGDGQGVYARIYTATGVGGTEFLVNTTTTGTQQASAIGVAADGSFVITWEGNGTGDTGGVFAQRFNAGGTKDGGEIRVNQAVPGTLYDPAIAVGQDGQFMVVWDNPSGTTGRRFLANGTTLDANDILLHGDVTSGNADVATNGTGDYHIVWRTTGGGDGSGRAIWRMSLGSADTTATTLFQVPATSINDQTEPAITSDGNGDFIVTWQGAGPGDTDGVFARKFKSDGTAIGTEFQLNETASGSQIAVSASMVDLDNFVSVWSGNGTGDSSGVFARAYGNLTTGNSLLFTTWGDENSSGVPGLESWKYEDLLSLGDPNLTLGPNSSGTLSIVGCLSAYGDGNIFPDSFDVIQQDVLVGSGGNSVQLYGGDVLLSVLGNETLGALSVQSDDVFVFRPDVVGSFVSGSFFVLFEGMESVGGGSIAALADIDLIEQTTQMGDVLLQPGDLVVADSGNPNSALWVFHPTGIGAGTTTGSVSTLLVDSEIHLDKEIAGVQVIERDVVIGGVQLREGNLLITIKNDSLLGTNNLIVTEHDVALLDVTTTSVNGPANVLASLLLTGSDINLDSGAEAIQTLALQAIPGVPPTARDETYTLTEDEAFDSSSQWFDANWSSRMSLTFDNSSRAENLDDFPVLVTLDTNRFDYSLAKANGEDLRFVDANGQLLTHEIETWNPTGRSAIWVKVPRIDASSSTDSIHLYYGNAVAVDVQNSAAVWSNGYVGVWHLNGNPSGTQTIADASSSNKDGTSIGMDATNQVSGPIGGALQFDGSSEAIRIDSSGTDPLAITGNHLTVEAWVNSTGGTGDWETILNRRNIVITPIQSYGLKTAFSDQSQVVHTTGTPDLSGVAGALPDDQWKYLTGVLSGSTSDLYINGIQNATGTTTSFGSSDQDVTIGAAEAGYDSVLSQYWKGGIDEVRLSNVARPAGWTAAQYASMTDTLITYGERQTVAGLLDNDQSATTGGLVVSSVNLSNLTGGATAIVQDDGQVTFVPGTGFQNLADGQSVSQQITYTAMDSNGNTNTATATFVIHGVNDAPVINTAIGPLALTSVNENESSIGGDTVAAIITSAGGTLISDADDGSVIGIAVTSVDTSHGTWEFSVDGSTWVSLTGVSDTSATLLSTSSYVRFLPTAGFSGAAGEMTFRAWDQTTGTIGQMGVNASLSGGTTAFSTQSTSASIYVTPINTAPVVVTNLGMNVSEGTTALLNSSLLAASDTENSPAQLIYALSTSPTSGRLERVADPGVAITTFTQAEINGNAVRYVHDGSETTSDSFSFSLSDGTVTVIGSFAITVTPVNDASVVSVNTGLTVAEGGNGVVNNTKLSAIDSDNSPAQLSYSVTTSPASGRLERVIAPGIAITTFTQAEINNNAIRYVHNGNETTSDSFNFSLSDGTATVTGSFAITVTPVNDAPLIAVNTGLTVAEGGNGVLSNTKLLASDSDNTAAQLTYSVTASPANGRLERVATPGVAITTFTQAEINSSAIRYVHNRGETTSDNFSFSLSDGVATVTGSFAITVTPVNDASIVAVNTGLTVAEGANGLLTSTVLSGTDPDNTAAQLIYTVTTLPANGRLERVAAPGTAIATFTQAELNSNAVRYVHNGGESSFDGFVFSLNDGTASVTGSFLITVTPVNDTPVFDACQMTISEGQTLTLSAVNLLTTDNDTPATALVYTVNTVANGRFERVASPGTAVTTFSQDDVNNSRVVFIHSGGESAPTASLSVSDGNTSVGPNTMVVTFSNVNDPPLVSTNTGLTLSEGATATITNTKLVASDPDNTASQRVFTVTTSPAHGRLEMSTNPGVSITTFTQANINSGVVRYVHDGGQTTADTFSFSLSDGTAAVTGSFAFTITAVNDAPILATNLGVTLLEGGSQLISNTKLAATDADNSSSQLIYSVTNSPAHGRLERVSAPGAAITTFTQADLDINAVRYAHNGGETTSDTFSFSLSDGAATVTGSFSMTVTPVNDAPVIGVNTGLIVNEGAGGVLTNSNLGTSDTDNTAAQLVYSLITSPTHGRLERIASPGTAITSFTQADINNNAIRYVHDGSETTSDGFGFSLSDGTAITTDSFSITVTPANDAPVIAMNTGLTVNEGGNGVLTNTKLAAIDSDNSAAQRIYSVTTSPAHGRLERVATPGVSITTFTQADLNTSAVRYVHDGGETTSDGFSFSLSDGTATVTDSFSINVTPVNDLPVVSTNTGLVVMEAGTVTVAAGYLNTTDAEQGPAGLTYTVTGGLEFGHLALATAPAVAITSFSQSQINNNEIVYVHGGAESTADYFTFSVSDGTSSVTGTLSLTISPVSDAPVFAARRITLTEGQVQTLSTFHLLTIDNDTPATALIYTVNSVTNGQFESALAPGVAITSFSQDHVSNARVIFVHNGTETAPTATLTVTDGTTSVGPNSWLVTFSNSNDPPTMSTNTGLSVSEGGSGTIGSTQLSSSDPDNTPSQRVFTVSTGPANGRLEKSTNAGVAITSFTQADINSGVVRYVHNGGDTTNDTFVFTLSDGSASATGSFTVNVTPVNDAPAVITNTGLTVGEGGTAALTGSQLSVSDSDNSAAQLIYTVGTLPTNGHLERVAAPGTAIATFTQADLNSGAVRYVHNGGNTTTDLFSFTLSDGSIALTGSFAITVTPVNDLPVITINAGLGLHEGASGIIGSTQLSSTDTDNSPSQLVYTVTTSAVYGRLERTSNPGVVISSFTQADLSSGTIRYVHDGGESTSDSLAFSLSDGTGTVNGTFVINVTPVNDAPVLGPHVLTIQEGQTITLTAANVHAIDADSGVLTFVVSGVSHGEFRNTTSGLAVTSFTSSEIQSGVVTFTHDGSETAPAAQISVTDGLTSTAAVAIQVAFTNLNDSPVITPESFWVPENAAPGLFVGQVQVNDADAGDSHTFSLLAGTSSSLFFIDSNSGEIRVAAGATLDFEMSSAYSLDVQVVDQGGAIAQATIHVNLQDTNESPIALGLPVINSVEDVSNLTLDLKSGWHDPETEALHFEIVSTTNSSLFSSASIDSLGILHFSGAAHANGISQILIKAIDPSGLEATSTVEVRLAPVNDTPVARGEVLTIPNGSDLVFSDTALLSNDFDVDHDALSIVVTRQPAHGQIIANPDGTWTYRPSGGFSNDDSFEYVVSDGATQSASAVVTLKVIMIGPGTSTNSSTTDSTSSNSSNTDESSTTTESSSGKGSGTSGSQTGTGAQTTGTGSPGTGGSASSSGDQSEDSKMLAFMPMNAHDDDVLFVRKINQGMDELSPHNHSRGVHDASRNGGRSSVGHRDSLASVSGFDPLAVVNPSAMDSLNHLRAIFASEANQAAFEGVSESLQSNLAQELVFEAPAIAGASLTVGYVVWMLRGGVLITSLLAQMPAWRIVDPLAVLDSLDKSEEDDESLGSLLEQGQSELEPVV